MVEGFRGLARSGGLTQVLVGLHVVARKPAPAFRVQLGQEELRLERTPLGRHLATPDDSEFVSSS